MLCNELEMQCNELEMQCSELEMQHSVQKMKSIELDPMQRARQARQHEEQDIQCNGLEIQCNCWRRAAFALLQNLYSLRTDV